ncbi:MAG: S41 family peptidase [Rhodospirillales bacterium]|nr:S41 family peptidase [Rhodospirillales bacterium]
MTTTPNRGSNALAAFFAGTLALALASCTSNEFSMSRGSLHGIVADPYAMPGSAESEMQRFEATLAEFAAPGSGPEPRQQFADAFRRVRIDYVREVRDDQLVDAAIRGVRSLNAPPHSMASTQLVETALDSMLTSLDPHSAYLTPDELREVRASNAGEFGGLGIEVAMEDDAIKVVSPIEDTPASRSGLKAGDLITHLDQQSVHGFSLVQAVAKMRGRPGSDVKLTVKRPGVDRAFDVTVTRAIIRVQSVRARAEGNVGYIRVTSFTEKVETDVAKEIARLEASIGPDLKGYVLDLRNNPGGLLDQAVALSDIFLDEGAIVSIRGRRDSRAHEARSGDAAHALPIVVLVNRGSASASEIVAAALQDHGRAQIMGVRTFGKGTVQTIMSLPRGGGLRMTTQLYYSPAGRAIQGQGIDPDIAVGTDDGAEARREADLPGAIAALPQPVRPAARRPQTALREADCPVAGTDDRPLGCALLLLRSGSTATFLASLGKPETAPRP